MKNNKSVEASRIYEACALCFSCKRVTNIENIYTLLPKVLGHPLLIKDLTTLVISMSTNLNV